MQYYAPILQRRNPRITLLVQGQSVNTGFWNQTHFSLAPKQRPLTTLLVCSYSTHGNLHVQLALKALSYL